VLPHPKEAIVAAIERQILLAPNQELVDWLITGSIFLRNFLDGVGSDPLPLLGEELGPPHRGEMTPEAVEQIRRKVYLIANSPNRKRADEFEVIANREAKLIEERIDAVVRLRAAWHPNAPSLHTDSRRPSVPS
jgi:hypothetical protein